jgi:hypothetical protein
MSYHLELPSRYLQAGRIFHVEENLYSGYPQLTEILYGVGLALDGETLAGLISLTSFLLTLLLLWGWGRRMFGDEGSAWGLAFLALSPPLMVLVGFFHNDWLAAFFTLAAVLILIEGSRKPGTMFLAGVMAGLAAGCKYTALAFAAAAPLVAGIVVDLLRKDKFRAGPWCLFMMSGAIIAAPWYLKNLVFTGDPLYPLLAGLTGKVQGLTILALDTHHKGLALSDLWRWITVPFSAVFRTWDLQFHISPGLLPVVLLPTLLSLRGSRTGSRYLGFWVLLSLLAWYLSFRIGRFLLPVLAVGFLYLGAGFARAALTDSPWGRALRALTVLMLIAGIGSFIGFDAMYMNRTGAAMGTVAPEEYLRDNHPPYAAIDYLNRLDPLPEKVLFLGEMKGFYSRFPREVATFDKPNRLIEMVKQDLTAKEMQRVLRENRFSHILLNPFEMKRLAGKSSFLHLNSREESVLAEFLSSRAKLVFEAKGVYVFDIT